MPSLQAQKENPSLDPVGPPVIGLIVPVQYRHGTPAFTATSDAAVSTTRILLGRLGWSAARSPSFGGFSRGG